MTYDGECFRTAASPGLPNAYAEFFANAPPEYGPGTGPYQLLQGDRPVQVAALAAEDAYLAGEPNRRALADLGGARTTSVVPLRKDNDFLGVGTSSFAMASEPGFEIGSAHTQ